MRNWRTWTGILPYAGILLAMLALLNNTYPEVYRHPSENLLADAGDGWKNYYTFLYHAEHDDQLLEFSGMHYPFGEHIVYADAQPLFSGALSLLDQVWPGGTGNPVIWLNLALLLAFPLGACFLYRVLRTLDVPGLLAAAGAVALIWLCPQVTRLPFYLGLAYPFILPMGLRLYLRYRKSVRPWRWTLVLVGFTVLAGLLHPYWILQLTVMFGALGLMRAFIRPGKRIATILPALVQTFLPLLIFALFMLATDQHEGRNPDPGGFYEFTSTPGAVFLPGELAGTWYENAFSRDQQEFYQHWEGRAYIGWLGNLTWLAVIGFGIWALFRRKNYGLPAGVVEIAGGSLLVLMLAMGIPFQVPGLEFLAETLPAIKQFRAMGRLALLFYFGSGILGMVLLSRLVRWPRHWAGQLLAWSLAIGACYVTLQEGHALHEENRRVSPPRPNLFSAAVLETVAEESDLSEAVKAIEPAQFQGIVPLPFYHIGSEALSPKTASQRNCIRESMVLSFHTGLPLTSAYMSRTSLSETRKALTFFAPEYWDKPLQAEFPSKKDLLLYRDKRVLLDAGQERIRKRGNLIFENATIELRALPFASLWENKSEPLFQSVENPIVSGLQPSQGFLVTRGDKDLVYKDFEGKNSSITFRGQGAWEVPQAATSVLYRFSEAPFAWTVGKLYKVSFWYNHATDRTHVKHFIGVQNAQGEYVPQIQRPDAFEGFVTEGDWTLVNWLFQAPENVQELAIVFVGKYGKNTILVDELYIHPGRMHLYQPLERENGRVTRMIVDNMEIRRKLVK